MIVEEKYCGTFSKVVPVPKFAQKMKILGKIVYDAQPVKFSFQSES